jgi:hypothetical protein
LGVPSWRIPAAVFLRRGVFLTVSDRALAIGVPFAASRGGSRRPPYHI